MSNSFRSIQNILNASKRGDSLYSIFNYFKTREDIIESSRKGNSLYSIYQHLEKSEALLKEHQKTAFELLSETLLPSLNEDQAQELAQFPTDSLEIYTTTISILIAQILSQFKGNKLFLNGVKQIDETMAKVLSQFQGKYPLERKLSLNGLEHLNEETAKVLSQFVGIELYLNGVQQLDEVLVKALDPQAILWTEKTRS